MENSPHLSGTNKELEGKRILVQVEPEASAGL